MRNRKIIKEYFSAAVDAGRLPDFESIRPLLKERESRGAYPVKFMQSLAVYSALTVFALGLVAAGFYSRAPFTYSVVALYETSDLEPVVRDRGERARRFIVEVRDYHRGGK